MAITTKTYKHIILLLSSLLFLIPSIQYRHYQHSFVVDAFSFPNNNNPLTKIQKDYLALTRRVTARHILLPKSDQVAFALKQKIRDTCIDNHIFVIDAFERYANAYSQDNTTNTRGGLLGELVPQGYCVSPELDQACFQVELGQIVGPIETEYGYHLLLVSERTNCPKLDGKETKLVPDQTNPKNGFGILVQGEQVGTPNAQYFANVGALFLYSLLFGGILAEVIARLLGE